jgi:alkanesulfonate monooxygenase
MIACALGRATRKLKFIVAYRSGLLQPTTFVQQLNTLTALIDGRVAVNIVAGSSSAEQRGYGDFLDHDERYARAEEFLAICHAFWSGQDEVDFHGKYFHVDRGRLHTPYTSSERTAPEIYVSGHSLQAEHLAISQGSCWLRLIDTPEALAPVLARMRERGVEVCLRLGLICRPTRDRAIEAAKAMLPDEEIGRRERAILASSESKTLQGALAKADTAGWMNQQLWAGLVPYYGSSAITLLGSPREVADAFLQYERIGVTQFIISGWPKLDEMVIFGRDVLPLIREAEEHWESR